jgi:hypothetical protein
MHTSNFNYAELAKIVIGDRNVPSDPNEPFVIDDMILVNDLVPSESIIRVSYSTLNLIGLTKRRDHICADTTWKLIWEGINSTLFFLY